ncbi:MAG: T9SS type A sorting domain-containing protein [Clostridium sp.]|nr:T9SS type A sorting domain-containing protein [Prevotella sp.]MCM1428529.1 T9SS type A sorting domain-containing protein [Clostridium sp.]MCM1474977.1 T9SS type A sorting domain-containing protein [Muribaculaceae bacterium]
MRFKKILQLSIALLLTVASPTISMAKDWESLKPDRPETRQVVKESDIELRAARGIIVVNTNHPVQIKVFTILGQLISSETVPAGTSQFTVTSHGIYIVKVGGLTCKVAL